MYVLVMKTGVIMAPVVGSGSCPAWIALVSNAWSDTTYPHGLAGQVAYRARDAPSIPLSDTAANGTDSITFADLAFNRLTASAPLPRVPPLRG